MKVYRYMSIKEFAKMNNGSPMRNRTPHYRYNRTTSMGFCFLPEEVVCTRKESYDIEEHRWITAKSIVTPEYAWRFLEGIVDDDVLVEFEAPEELLQKTVGMYADYDDHNEDIFDI